MNFFERQRQVRRMSVRLVAAVRDGRDRHRGRRSTSWLRVRLRRVQSSSRPAEIATLVGRPPSLVLASHLAVAVPHRRRCAAAAAGSPASWAACSCRPTPPTPSCAGCATWSRRSPSRPACPCRRSTSCRTSGHQRVRRRVVHVGRRRRGDPRRAGAAQPRRAAGRDRARVQPRGQRRHAAQHPADGAAVRHPVPRRHRPHLRQRRHSSAAAAAATTRASGNPLPSSSASRCSSPASSGCFAGRIIKASVSRQREYLADASAVQFTRQTSGHRRRAEEDRRPGGRARSCNSPKTRRGRPHALRRRRAGSARCSPPTRRCSNASRCSTRPSTRPSWPSSPASGRPHPPSGMAEDVALGFAAAPAPADSRPAAGRRARCRWPRPTCWPTSPRRRRAPSRAPST